MEFFFEDIDTFNFAEESLIEYVNELIVSEKGQLGDVSVIFCSDNYLLQVNKQYLNHDYYTDIITFDYVDNDIISGDLFISVDRIKENALEYQCTFIRELYRVVFHGVLHLVGYNDKTDEEQNLMTKKENQYLGVVDFEGLIL
jgi:rRNA maturation RNase YbeY